MSHPKNLKGIDMANSIYKIEPKVGMVIRGDKWKSSELLIESDWDKAQFRHEVYGCGPITSMACNIRVTGRTIVKNKYFDDCIRIEISVPDDGEELGCKFSGWLKIRDYREGEWVQK
jgi:hypothetical protein